jgi:hypothetical protein
VPDILAVVVAVVGDVVVVDTVTVVVHVLDVALNVALAPRAAYVPCQDTHSVHPDIDEDLSYASFLTTIEMNNIRKQVIEH